MMARRLCRQLEAAPGQALAVVALGPAEPPALSVGSLAVSLAYEGQRVVLVDMADGRPLGSLFRAKASPVPQKVVFDGQLLTLVVAPPDPSQLDDVLDVLDEADSVLVLASISPARGAEHVAAWAASAVVVVERGQGDGHHDELVHRGPAPGRGDGPLGHLGRRRPRRRERGPGQRGRGPGPAARPSRPRPRRGQWGVVRAHHPPRPPHRHPQVTAPRRGDGTHRQRPPPSGGTAPTGNGSNGSLAVCSLYERPGALMPSSAGTTSSVLTSKCSPFSLKPLGLALLIPVPLSGFLLTR